MILAQVPTEVQFILNLVGAVGIPGILAWYLYYNTTVTQPKQLDKWDAITKANNATVEKICSDFVKALEDERHSREKVLENIYGICHARDAQNGKNTP